MNLNGLLSDLLQRIGKIATGGWWWKRLFFLVVQLNYLINNATELVKNLLFVGAVAPAIDKPRCATDKNTDPLRTIRLSWRRVRFRSFFRLLDGLLNRPRRHP